MIHLLKVGCLLTSIALLAAACGDDTSDEAAPPTTTAPAATSPPSTAAPTTTAPTATAAPTTLAPTTTTTTTTAPTTATTTTLTEPACPGTTGALPGQAEFHSLAGGDVNGDGSLDTIHTYTIGDPDQIGAWWVQVSFANGGGATFQIHDPGVNLSGAQPFDGFDINGNGRDEFFIRVGAGVNTSIVGLFEVVDCAIQRIPLDGQPSEFAVGESVNFVSGFECIDIDGDGANDVIVVYTGSRVGESDEFEITAAQYSALGGSLNFMFADGLGGNVNDAEFSKFSAAGCPGVFL